MENNIMENSHSQSNFFNTVQKEVKKSKYEKTIEATTLKQCAHAY